MMLPQCVGRTVMLVLVLASVVAQGFLFNPPMAGNSTTDKKILIVLSSCDKMLPTGLTTGWYLPELAHPYKVLTDAGFTNIDVISPKGGKAPLDQYSAKQFKNDPVCQWFQSDATAQEMVNTTKLPSQVDPKDYAAVLIPGGHGPMFDLANNTDIAAITAQIYEAGGVVASVCHGPAAFVPVKLSSGESIVKGKQVTSFTNSEEVAGGLAAAVPFMLETKLKELGGIFSGVADWQANVVTDGRLITGQNPASAKALGEALVVKLSES